MCKEFASKHYLLARVAMMFVDLQTNFFVFPGFHTRLASVERDGLESVPG